MHETVVNVPRPPIRTQPLLMVGRRGVCGALTQKNDTTRFVDTGAARAPGDGVIANPPTSCSKRGK